MDGSEGEGGLGCGLQEGGSGLQEGGSGLQEGGSGLQEEDGGSGSYEDEVLQISWQLHVSNPSYMD